MDDDVIEALIAYPAKSFPHLDFYEEIVELRTAELFENKELVYNKTRQQFEDEFKQRIKQATLDKSAFFQVYLEDNKPLGVVTLFVRQEYVHVYELQVKARSRYQGIAKKLLRNAEGKFPGRIFYGVIHNSNPMLHAYLKNGCSESPFFHQVEHPQWRKEDGWVSLIYPSLANEKETPLARLQNAVGLEAIQDVTGIARPVFLIQDDAVVNEPEKWLHVGNKTAIDQKFVELNKKLHCIGAVETRDGTLIGTCWLIYTGYVCTNKHVAAECYRINSVGEVIGTIQRPMVNFKREHGRTDDPASRFAVEKLVYVDPDVDLAIFKLQGYTGTDYLVLEDAPFDDWKNLVEDEVYVVGYPGRDATRNPERLMIKIFGKIYEKKRLAFGKLMDYKQEQVFYHNASTLGGNSGSPILGTSSLRVLGLHFGGAYNVRNECVAYPKLQEIIGRLLPQLTKD